MNITLHELKFEDKEAFLKTMLSSQSLHHPWVTPPLTSLGFDEYWHRSRQSNQKSYLACNELGTIVGVFNISEIVRGAFQNDFLGFHGESLQYLGRPDQKPIRVVDYSRSII